MYQNSSDMGYRGRRIVELLEDLAPNTIDTFRQIHRDNYDRSAEKIVPLFADLDFGDDNYNNARDWLTEWDYQMDARSGQAALYGIFWDNFERNIFDDQIADFIEDYGIRFHPFVIVSLTSDPNNDWWDNAQTEDIETMDDILIQSLQNAYDEAVERMGADRVEWRWGTIHLAEFVNNPLGLSGIEQLEDIVNRHTSIGGSHVTVNAARSNENYIAESGVSERVIYDVSDWDNSLSIQTTGQSGHPYSQDYDSMIEAWANFQYKPMLWSRDRVQVASINKLILTP